MAGAEAEDSGARLVAMESDSDVRIVPPDEIPLGEGKPPSGTDSDIRLEGIDLSKAREKQEGLLTEEINLDEELQKQEAAKPPAPQAKVRPGTPALPKSSPFELSELHEKPAEAPKKGKGDTSSDFELTPAGESSSPLEGGDEFNLELSDSEVSLGEPPASGKLKGKASGINLDKPIDSGISLEQGGDGSDEIEFELTLDDDQPSSHPGPAALDPSSSEFELTLDADEPQLAPDSDSEFELTLGVDDSGESKPAGESSSSEFELTLDAGDSSPPESSDSSSDSEFELTLEPADRPAGEGEGSSDSEFELSLEPADSSPAEGATSDAEFEVSLDESGADLEVDAGAVEGDPDIFETDLDAPSLEESGSEALALDDSGTGDTDLESSDFDIALDEGDAGAEDESGSQVVGLEEDEEDADAPPAPRGRRGKGRAAPALEEEAGFEGLGEEGEEGVAEEEEEEAEEPVLARQAVAAPWGPLPVLFMLPCVVVMFLVGLMGFELIQTMSGYKQPGLITKAVSGLILPK
jgi:hypothetical protein